MLGAISFLTSFMTPLLYKDVLGMNSFESGIWISVSYGAGILNLPFGGFITLGVLIAVMQYALKKGAKKKAAKEHEEKLQALLAAEEEAE